MNNKIIASYLFLNIKNNDNNETKNNKLNKKKMVEYFTDLFGIDKSTLYRWTTKYKETIEDIDKYINGGVARYDFFSINISFIYLNHFYLIF